MEAVTDPAHRLLLDSARSSDSSRSRAGFGALQRHRTEDATLIGLLANLAECNAAFGAGNLPTDWFWVHKFNAAGEEQGSPGAFAAYFVSMGFTPIHRRLERALCRYVQTD
mgnify:CR=1 FL=1